jgi:uncharacterized pyridoxal phosphate-containing UPF0001 family protein
MDDGDLATEAAGDAIAVRLKARAGADRPGRDGKAGRDPRSVALVAVSKTHGIRAVGRRWPPASGSSVRTACRRRRPNSRSCAPTIPTWQLHLIGPLQTNKVKDAVALFDVIETVDRPKLAAKLAEEMQKSGRRPRCYIQVNIGNEPQKAGVAPHDISALLAFSRDEYRLPVVGLMCIPPADQDPAPYFAQMAALAKRTSCRS